MRTNPSDATTTPGFDWYSALFILLLLFSIGIRVYLALSGGQFYWGDEIRFEHAQKAAQLALQGLYSQALSPESLSIEHIWYKLTAAFLEYCRIKAGLGPEFSYIVFSQFSALNIVLVWLIALTLHASRLEAFLSASFMAATASMLFFSRHLVPYDMALTYWLAALLIVSKDRPSFPSLFLCGVLSALCFLSYNGCWFLLPSIPLVYIIRQRRSFRTLGLGHLVMGLGLISALYLIVALTGRTVASSLHEFAEFSTTVTMGDYGDGWIFPIEYLWYCDGFVFVYQTATFFVLASLVAAARSNEREKIIIAVLIVTYLLLAGSSAIMRIFVVYGRTARILVPLLSLAAGNITARYVLRPGCGFFRRAGFWTLLLALTAHNYWPPVTMVFSDRFMKPLGALYGGFFTNKAFWFSDSGDPEPSSISCPEFIIAHHPSPRSYIPYRYESTSRATREFMATRNYEHVFLKCRFDLPQLDIDFFHKKIPPDIMTTGIAQRVTQLGMDTIWVLGPEATIEFWEQGNRDVEVSYELFGIGPTNVDVTVSANGLVHDSFNLTKHGDTFDSHKSSFVFKPQLGLNKLTFSFSDWNGKTEYFIQSDHSPFASAFTELRLTNAKPSN